MNLRSIVADAAHFGRAREAFVALTVLLLLPDLLSFITLDWVETLVAYLPMPAAAAFVTVSESTLTDSGELTAGTGVLVVAAYAVVPMVAASIMLRRRDA